MGKMPVRVAQVPRLPTVTVSSGLHERVTRAARQAEQPIAAWIRMAVLEKLERDGQ